MATASGHTFDPAWSPSTSGAAVTVYLVTVSGGYAGTFTVA